MQTSLAVFLATTVIYFVSTLLPFKASQQSVGWAAQATMATGVVATFMVMKAQRLTMVQAALVFACFALIAGTAVLVSSACLVQKNKWQCEHLLPLHTVLFSSAFLTGSAAYIGYGLGSALGMPLWATIVASIVFAPFAMAVATPLASKAVTQVCNQLA